jgi:hypothetical protein
MAEDSLLKYLAPFSGSVFDTQRGALNRFHYESHPSCTSAETANVLPFTTASFAQEVERAGKPIGIFSMLIGGTREATP